MRNKLLKKLSLVLAVLIAVVSCLTFAFADTTVGSITVELNYDGYPVTSYSVLTLYYVASINSDGSYSYTDSFVGYSDDDSIKEAFEDTNAAWLLWQWANSVGAAGTTYEVTDGTVTFSDTVAGIYLIVPTVSPSNFNIDPVLVSVPDVYGDGEYDVTVEAKLEFEQPDTPDGPGPSTTTTVTTVPDEEVTTDGSGGEEGDTDDEIDISENETTPEEEETETLPQTGQLNYPIPIMAGAGAFCVAAGLIVTRTEKKK